MIVRCLVALVAFVSTVRAEKYDPMERRFEVDTILDEWTDPARKNRVVPVKIYLPRENKTPAAVVLYSHGLGGSREVGGFAMTHWASRGFACVAVQHPGSDSSILRDKTPADRRRAMARAATVDNLMFRIGDVSFVIDELVRRSEIDGPLKGRLDTTRIAMSGHSFGAGTTQALIGERFGTPRRVMSFAENRIDCALLFSPSPAKSTRDQAWAFGGVTVPAFHFTGTLDNTFFGDFEPIDRRVPFDNSVSPAWLLIFNDADHMVFSGVRFVGDGKNDDRHHLQICQASTAFLDAHLSDSDDARRWLDESLRGELDPKDTLESRPAR
jgi:hypothetical protein